MKIVSWNTNGLRATVKQGFFEDLFKKVKGDVICFQETKVEKEQLPDEVRNISGYESYFESSKKSSKILKSRITKKLELS